MGMAPVTDTVSLLEIERARDVVADVARETQVIESRYLSRTTGGTIALIYTGWLGDRAASVLKKLPVWPFAIALIVCSHPDAGPLQYLRPYAAATLVGASLTGAPEFLKRILESRLDRAITPATESALAITLAAAVLKGDKMDDVVRDAVMLGVAVVQPLGELDGAHARVELGDLRPDVHRGARRVDHPAGVVQRLDHDVASFLVGEPDFLDGSCQFVQAASDENNSRAFSRESDSKRASQPAASACNQNRFVVDFHLISPG